MPEKDNEVNGMREIAWKDTLTADELSIVDRLSSMPPAMAVAFVYVELQRQIHEKPKPVMQHAYAGLSGGFVASLALLVHAMGWDKVVTK